VKLTTQDIIDGLADCKTTAEWAHDLGVSPSVVDRWIADWREATPKREREEAARALAGVVPQRKILSATGVDLSLWPPRLSKADRAADQRHIEQWGHV
jgi:hypothetical protein